jgi:pimeloyl-ACP methyl ester carboxylesterase
MRFVIFGGKSIPEESVVKLRGMKQLCRVAIAFLASIALAQCRSTYTSLNAVHVNGVDLHYVDIGKGTPLVFVHGGFVDYREWLPTIEAMGPGYRSIAYSRRYNFPNHNALPHLRNHSVEVEAEDLRALIERLKIAPVDLVGVSYGGFTALELAVKHPEMVRRLVVVEPAILSWLPDIPGGPALLDDFNARLMMPTREAFRSGKPDDVLRVAITYFVGSPDAYDHIPPEFRDRLRGNIAEWEAITTSSNAFPMIDRAAVHRLPMPVLMLSGEKSYAIGKAIDAELERVLVTEKRVIIPNGTHDMCTEYPAACAAEIKRFLESH